MSPGTGAKAASAPRVLYIAGSGRSGSTALARLLEERLDAVHVGEARYLWERGLGEDHLCECGEPFSRCAFWTTVLSRAYGEGVGRAAEELAAVRGEVDEFRRIPQLSLVARGGRAPYPALRRYADVVGPLYRAIGDTSGSAVTIDSSKDPSYLFSLAAAGVVDLAVIHLVRDSRAVAYSWTRRKRRPEVTGSVTYMKTVAPWRIAAVWTAANAAIAGISWTGRPVVRMRYEDFARDPEGEVGRAAGVLGLAARTGAEAAGHSFSGNPMRFDRGPVRVRLDEEWRTALPTTDRRRVTAISAPLLARYGYLGR